MRTHSHWIVTLVLTLAGCSDEPFFFDGGPEFDGGVSPDVREPEADSSVEADASAADATVADAIAPRIDGGPPTHARDGWCAEGDWATCIDFDGFGDAESGGRREMTGADQRELEIEYWGYDVGSVWRAASPIYELECKSGREEGTDCEPKLEEGQIRMSSESEAFGITTVRLERPFELDGSAARHFHFDTSLTIHGRQFITFHVSEMPAASMPDMRLLGISTSSDDRRSFSVVFTGGSQYAVDGIHWNPPTGECRPGRDDDECFDHERLFHGDPGFRIDPTDPALRDRMHSIDIFLSRTHVRVEIDESVLVDADIADIGFDRGYMSVASVGYNPLKEDGGQDTWRGELNSSLVDNLAFDGPTLPRNGLIPPGQELIVFHASGAASCSVAGFPSSTAPYQDVAWNPVYTFVPAGTPVSEADIECSHAGGSIAGEYRSMRRHEIRP